MKNIMDLLDNESGPVSQVKLPSPVLYDPSGWLKKAPELFTRNEKLAFVESLYKTQGLSADKDKLMLEIQCSAGLSRASFLKAREYGLHCHYERNRSAGLAQSPSVSASGC